MGTHVTHQCLQILAVQPGADGGFFLKVCETLNGRVIKDAAHEYELVTQSLFDNLVDGALRREDGDTGFRVGRQPESMDAIEALKETTGGEVAVDVHGVVAFVMQADALAERCWVGQENGA
jgi:hypothetical protein